jgi:hypothetical protein
MPPFNAQNPIQAPQPQPMGAFNPSAAQVQPAGGMSQQGGPQSALDPMEAPQLFPSREDLGGAEYQELRSKRNKALYDVVKSDPTYLPSAIALSQTMDKARLDKINEEFAKAWQPFEGVARAKDPDDEYKKRITYLAERFALDNKDKKGRTVAEYKKAMLDEYGSTWGKFVAGLGDEIYSGAVVAALAKSMKDDQTFAMEMKNKQSQVDLRGDQGFYYRNYKGKTAADKEDSGYPTGLKNLDLLIARKQDMKTKILNSGDAAGDLSKEQRTAVADLQKEINALTTQRTNYFDMLNKKSGGKLAPPPPKKKKSSGNAYVTNNLTGETALFDVDAYRASKGNKAKSAKKSESAGAKEGKKSESTGAKEGKKTAPNKNAVDAQGLTMSELENKNDGKGKTAQDNRTGTLFVEFPNGTRVIMNSIVPE